MAGAAATVLVCGLWFSGSAVAAGDANRVSCASETEASPGFRDWLPDCRAYELVSPAYGAGALAHNVHRKPPVSVDGEHILAESFGAFADAEELGQDYEEYGDIYEFSRTSAGWTAEPQDPSANLYPYRHFLLSEDQLDEPADLGRSIWAVAPPQASGQEREARWRQLNSSLFVVREGRGRFAVVGPSAAPGHEPAENTFGQVEGVSADGSHILFNVVAVHNQLWPGDSTAAGGSPALGSLYEYHGTAGGEPVLVGVRNEGPPPWEVGAAHVNEGAELISQCGTRYDGMSVSGERVFFTAQHLEGCSSAQPPVGELYARVDGARTVAISEPSKQDCALCNTSEGLAEARFAGASEDGSKVFFVSEQELLAGAAAASLYEYDFDAPEGERVKLLAANITTLVHKAEGQPEIPAEVARGGSRVYFESTSMLTQEANGNGEKAVGGQPNLYVYDAQARERPLVFVADGEGAESFDATRDGQFLVFVSPQHLGDPTDTSTVRQLFEYDATTGGVARVSVGQRSSAGFECEATHMLEEGYDCDGNTSVASDAPRIVPFPGQSVAENGTVVFVSQLPLTPGSVQGHTVFNEVGTSEAFVENVYEYRDGQVYLISPGDEATPAFYLGNISNVMRLIGIDESGEDVFFSSVDGLVPQDSDGQSSWYDAREEGGFPAPAAEQGCSGEACQGAFPQSPVFAGPGSGMVGVSGNLVSPVASKPTSSPPRKRCRKGYVRRRGRCVRVRSRKAAARRAGRDGGAR